MNAKTFDEPAFPHWDGPSGQCFNGMTLRDYFAAKLAPCLVAAASTDKEFESVGAAAYLYADQMLKARES